MRIDKPIVSWRGARRQATQSQAMAGPAAQRGAAFLLLIGSLMVLATLLFWRQVRAGPMQVSVAQHNRLQEAKEALIARAVTDANRPGSLPCPDLITDEAGLSNHPNDGKADPLTRNDCPSYLGWLPWSTLGLPEQPEGRGTRLWYRLSRSLRDDDLAQPIHSDTEVDVTLDGQGDIAALLIVPGPALGAQQRPSNQPADHLETLDSGSGQAFVRCTDARTCNDQFLILSRRALFAAVEKRVAGEVLACLTQHLADTHNADGALPWPAPFSALAQRGRSGSRFGQLPLTQPDAGPARRLASLSGSMQADRATLAAAAPVSRAQKEALQVLASSLPGLRQFADSLFARSKSLALAAQTAADHFENLGGTLTAANSNGRVSATEKKTIQTAASQADTPVATLQTELADSGFDAFPSALERRSLALNAALSPAASARTVADLPAYPDALADLGALLGRALARQTDVAAVLATTQAQALAAQTQWQAAQALPNDSTLLLAALAEGQQLARWIPTLLTQIDAQRSGVHSDDLATSLRQQTQMLARYQSALEEAVQKADERAQARADLVIALNDSLSGFGRLPGLGALGTKRQACLLDLEQALSGVSADSPPVMATLLALFQQADQRCQEALDQVIAQPDNVAAESLRQASARFVSQRNTFNTVSGRTQAEMVPYAEQLRLATVDLQFWAEIMAEEASQVATLARKSPSATKTQVNAGSAYTLADQALQSIESSSGSLKKVQDALDDPGRASKASAAAAAVATTLAQVDALVSALGDLAQALHSSTADAFPTAWQGSRCGFLQPQSEGSSWWTLNRWADTLFYQIDRPRGNARTDGAGRLQVNGRAGYRVVVLSAGRALDGQSRGQRTAAAYFEGANADVSRDASAEAPSPRFVAQTPGEHFNDRLAY